MMANVDKNPLQLLDWQRVCVLDDYEIVGVINRGSFGVVYKAREKKSGNVVALKDEVHGLGPAALMEINILESLPRHPNIVDFKGAAVEDDGRVYVVMECLNYDLKRLRLARGKPFSLLQIKWLMHEILKGVEFLHDNGVMHRDLKPANILLGDNNTLKICDFGLAARSGRSFGAGVGTTYYKAPEVLVGCCSYTCAMDMWSLGCIMAELVLDKPLFEATTDDEQLACIQQMRNCNLLRQSMASLSVSGMDLLERLLEYYPNLRISAAHALAHPWFTHD